ncbi:IclR family transcriptional regulator [Saxibacter everestensis]|uniref:IclR family transcriptional regulator n=1 Tax=Saxibacter everestensis TaxID=2909229 RepID=A0ABY8QXW9_9MICO|nr:IclR family transcriptional regulator [Brevibacteriaceae bacterium ZFBP1038]
MANGTQSIDRAAELVSLVVRSEGPLTFTELVEQTGLSRSTVSRLLQALERNGMLERDATGGYRGGALFAHYASRYDRVETLLSAAQPGMERIAEQTRETVYLGVPRGGSVVQVAQIDSSFILGATNWVDVDVPPHCSALGKVLFAFGAIPLPEEPLEPRTDKTITEIPALMSELEAVRKQGYAITHEELEVGLDALAAPVRGGDELVHAAIGVSGPSFRIKDSHDEIGQLLVAEAERISAVIARLVGSQTA